MFYTLYLSIACIVVYFKKKITVFDVFVLFI